MECFQEEKTLGQKFILSLELTLDFSKAAKHGDLSALSALRQS